ncbi:unnamed protein product [Menidia menidia]|uniref:(Atlantic silverside) hypothetical protein n=1 Tax=Menidia menidia TaxID=238744 RepID=A0A8S4B9W7_9TELE|nr:unnamed protein product [Menidia menidia]
MAATASYGRRGTGGLSMTKALFLIFSLLTLGCPGSSLIDDDQLEELQKNIKKLQKEVASRRADIMVDSIFISDVMEEVVHLMDLLTEVVKRTLPDVPPMLTFMGNLKAFLEECKVYIIKDIFKKAGKLDDHEKKLQHLEKLISNLAEQKAHL